MIFSILYMLTCDFHYEMKQLEALAACWQRAPGWAKQTSFCLQSTQSPEDRLRHMPYSFWKGTNFFHVCSPPSLRRQLHFLLILPRNINPWILKPAPGEMPSPNGTGRGALALQNLWQILRENSEGWALWISCVCLIFYFCKPPNFTA